MNIEQTPFKIPKKFQRDYQKLESAEGQTINTVDIRPNREESPIPVIFAPGMAANLEILSDSLEILADQGRRVLALEHLKDISIIAKHPENYSLIELQKSLTILSFIEKKKLEQVDLVATSEGALNALYAAFLSPEKFRNIVLVNPAGISGKSLITDLLKRAEAEMEVSIYDARDDQEVIEKLEKLRSLSNEKRDDHPGTSLREGWAISLTEVIYLLQYLKKQGISISIVSSAEDLIFFQEKIQKKVTKDLIDGFYSVKGGHYNFLTHPQNFMPLVSEALRALEEKLYIEESEEKNAWHVANDKYGELGMVREWPASKHRTFKDGIETTQKTAENNFRAFLPNGRRTPEIYATLEDAANDLRKIAKESANSESHGRRKN